MFRVLAILSIVNIFMPLAVSNNINNEEPETFTSKGEDIVFRVVNGVPANLGTIPYQVSLKTPIGRGSYMSFCGGSVITENKILSAAHCLTKDGNVCEKMCKNGDSTEPCSIPKRRGRY